ncbi:MAG TPA: FAD:protein FMN transferase [Verrucomicrobiae bacterium]
MNLSQTVTLARNAMATRFELVLMGEDPVRLRAAGEEALAEVDRLEARLSLYRPTSEIVRVNAQAAQQPVRVSPPVFRLLNQARQLHAETGGAFDIALAPLIRCWGFMTGAGHVPDAQELERIRAVSGMRHVLLDAQSLTVRFDQEGVMVDLGAIGKGYAIDRAADILREAGVAAALLHGGTSTVYGIGSPPNEEGWKVAIAGSKDESRTIGTALLRDSALSVSAVWAREFEAGGKQYGHVIDPRTGHPVNNAVLAAVALPSATETDALSTALLVLGSEGRQAIENLRPGMKTWLNTPTDVQSS